MANKNVSGQTESSSPAKWRCALGCQGHRHPLTGTSDPTLVWMQFVEVASFQLHPIPWEDAAGDLCYQVAARQLLAQRHRQFPGWNPILKTRSVLGGLMLKWVLITPTTFPTLNSGISMPNLEALVQILVLHNLDVKTSEVRFWSCAEIQRLTFHDF